MQAGKGLSLPLHYYLLLSLLLFLLALFLFSIIFFSVFPSLPSPLSPELAPPPSSSHPPSLLLLLDNIIIFSISSSFLKCPHLHHHMFRF
jgi:hypothetical protein